MPSEPGLFFYFSNILGHSVISSSHLVRSILLNLFIDSSKKLNFELFYRKIEFL